MILRLRGVEHAYRRTVALRGVSLAVEPEEVVAVTGPSGCGKSTLLHVAAGILRPQAGAVTLLDQDLVTLDDAERARLRRRNVGVVLQFGQLVPDLSALENVALPLLLERHDRGAALTAAREWLERAGVGDERDTLAAELSGGQAQRVAVARALVTGPSIVFADEPTGSLDSTGGEALLALLLAAARERGAALVIVTHDNVVAAHADREVRLRDGHVEAEAVLR
ncbi:ABC transporter ATP-binding protein [Solirubrobacter phytolaccae]|uniref:ABC transporter ATP-binding protein n=1 Tax=Solirubrobacter phytolaccae TaxID=1404360 RepID=A0A9X3S6R2_9ACTN|nr:ABC transporter ATP-binding protein [Solirubrobacter phytolaccae]MDA0179418.1 ABC transporter ATP-binding protein [Solirubrobacter phytolaccae]